MYTDVKVVIDQTQCERLSRGSRWSAGRIAMMRYGIGAGAVVTLKCKSALKYVDGATKRLSLASFPVFRDAVLGTRFWDPTATPVIPPTGPTWSAETPVE